MPVRQILHIVPESLRDKAFYFHGSTKDIASRTEYFVENKIEFEELIAPDRDDAKLLEKLKNKNLEKYDIALFEFHIFERSFDYLKKTYPHLKLVTRPNNAEFYHQWHHLLSTILNRRGNLVIKILKALKSFPSHLKNVRYGFYRLKLDFLFTKKADHVLSICPWEKNHYWKYFIPQKRLSYVPYFLPRQYLSSESTFIKKQKIVCLTATWNSPYAIDAAKRFISFVESIGDRHEAWEFILAGYFPEGFLPFPKRLTYLGVIDDPLTLLREAKALASLSPFGFGFKTKLLDAILCQNYIWVHRKLYTRLEPELKRYAIVVKPNSNDSLERAIVETEKPFPDGDLNQKLKMKSFLVLDRVLKPLSCQR